MKFDNIKSAIYLGKYTLLKPKAISFYRTLLKNQYLSQDELEDISWRKTKDLLHYAYDKAPYYKRTFDAVGLDPRDIVEPDDYRYVPVLTREALRENFPDIVSVDARSSDLKMSATGGSTGEPVRVYHEKRVVRAAMGWRMFGWWGLPPMVDSAWIWRENFSAWRSRMLQFLLCWPAKTICLNAANLNAESIAAFIRRFNKLRPRLVHGYVGAVDHLASYILENSVTVVPPVAVSTTSAPLTAVQAGRIEKAFGAPVYDQYGSSEVYWLGAECSVRENLHIFHDTRRLEFLNEQNSPCPMGTLGRIAVTDLTNRLFPLIRYLIGDMGRAVPGVCRCGVTLPLMEKVRGRISETLTLPGGGRVGGAYLTTVFDDYPDAVKQFQVHQKADFSIIIRVVPNTDDASLKAVLARLKAKLVNDLGGGVRINFETVENIPHIRGKLRYVVSDVQQSSRLAG